MSRRLAVLAACCMIVLAAPAWGGQRTIEIEHTYVLGEKDTRADARRACYMEARRKAVEQAGTYVESETSVRDMSLTSDEVRAFASAFVEAELMEEQFLLDGGAFAVRCRVRAVVDTDTLGGRLADYAADPGRRERLSGLAAREEQPGAEGQGAQGPGLAPPLRDLKELEAEKARIRAETERLSKAAGRVVSRGMTPGEVQGLLGPPRVKKLNDAMTSTYECHNYGDLWVVYKDGLVACTRKRLEYKNAYRSDCHCAGMAGFISYE